MIPVILLTRYNPRGLNLLRYPIAENRQKIIIELYIWYGQPVKSKVHKKLITFNSDYLHVCDSGNCSGYTYAPIV